MFRTITSVAAVLAVAATGISAAPASAGADVTVKTISTKTTPYKKPVKVTPRVSFSDNVSGGYATLTVKRGNKVIARNKLSAKLRPGTYKVTTTARYRKLVTKQTVKVAIPAGGTIHSGYSYLTPSILGGCDVTSFTSQTDFTIRCEIFGGDPGATPGPAFVNATDDDILSYDMGDGPEGAEAGIVFVGALRAPVNITETSSRRVSGPRAATSRTQTLKVRAGKKPRTCGTYALQRKVKPGMNVKQVEKLLGPGKVVYSDSPYKTRRYKACDKKQELGVVFENGLVWDTRISD